MTCSAPELDERARAAVSQARRRSRRAWRRYLTIVAVLLALLGVFVGLVYRTSEIRAVHVTTSSKAAVALPAGGLPVRMTRRWHTTDQPAAGTPVWLDVVITYSARTVTGRDATTGAPRWSYTRSDRRICSVVQVNGIAVAIYAHDANCDEATGLDASSGSRQWVRTLFDSGTDLTVAAISGQVLLVTPRATNLIDPGGGLDRWYDEQKDGCRTLSAVLGSAGVLLASGCPGGRDTLSLRASGSDKKRDWSVALAGRVPLAADTSPMVLSRDGRSVQLLSAKGRPTTTAKLPRAFTAPARPTAYDQFRRGTEVVAVGGGVVALDDRTGSYRWFRALPVLPVQTAGGLLLAGPDQVQTLSVSTGAIGRTVPAPGVRPGDRVGVLGRGVVAGNPTGTSALN